MCVILGFLYKIIDEDIEDYITPNAQMIVIYDKGNSHCQICHFCVVGYLRKTVVNAGKSSQLVRHGFGSLRNLT